nr:MAG TPA: hypothetical protein [Caudoviricetes sp.]
MAQINYENKMLQIGYTIYCVSRKYLPERRY